MPTDYEHMLRIFAAWKPVAGESTLGKYIRLPATTYKKGPQRNVTYFFDANGALIEVIVN